MRHGLCSDLVGKLGGDLGMGRRIKMDVVPLIKVGRDLRVKYDDADAAGAQPLHHRRYVGGALLLRETKAEIVGPRLQDDDVGTLGHRAVDALKHGAIAESW
jgi:hypothetical protein